METYKAGQGSPQAAAQGSSTTASTLPAAPQNFERAREERAAWPEWKQEHTLTKHSGAVQIAHPAAVPTMSSREIAELTGKRPADVMRDIRNMLEELNLAERSFASSYLDSTGRTLPMFLLPKDLTITLVSGYSIAMRHRIVTRWMELEEQGKPKAINPAFQLPQTFSEALRLAADLQESNERLTARNTELVLENTELALENTALAPKAAALETSKIVS